MRQLRSSGSVGGVVWPSGRAALSRNQFTEESLNTAATLFITGFELTAGFIIRENGPVVVKGANKTLAIAQQGITQPLLDPLGAFAGTLDAQERFGFREEDFGFLEPFETRFVAVFFLASVSSAWIGSGD
jgi:hypothetical protein